jgi:hypothetical protein
MARAFQTVGTNQMDVFHGLENPCYFGCDYGDENRRGGLRTISLGKS